MKQKVPYSTLFPRVPYHISSICVGLFRPQPNIWPTIRLSLISNGSDRFANKSLPLIFSIRWSKCERSTASDHPSLSTDVEGLTLSHLHATPRTCKHLCARWCACVGSLVLDSAPASREQCPLCFPAFSSFHDLSQLLIGIDEWWCTLERNWGGERIKNILFR